MQTNNAWVGRRARALKLRAEGARKRAQLAELVSEGLSLSAAARVMGISQQAASKHFKNIRNELGPQAV